MRYLTVFVIVICIQGVHRAGADDHYYIGDQPRPEESPMRYYVGDQIKPFYERAKWNYKRSKRIATLEDMIEKSSFWTGQCYQLNALIFDEYLASDLFHLNIHTQEGSDDNSEGVIYHLPLNSAIPHTHIKEGVYSGSDSVAYRLRVQRASTGELIELMKFDVDFKMRVHQREDHTYELIIRTGVLRRLIKYCRLWQKPND